MWLHIKGEHNSMYKLVFGHHLTPYCILWHISIVKICIILQQFNTPIPGYIKCNFGADFSQKLQIPILCLSLKMAMKYQIKHFEGSILALWGFFSSFGHNPSLYDVQKPMSGIFPIFVKKCTLEFESDLH